MTSKGIQQIIDLINRSKNILVFPSSPPDGDSLGSAIALYLGLNKLGKTVTVVSSEPVPSTFNFLPNVKVIGKHLSSSSDFIISLQYGQNEIEDIQTEFSKDKVNIIVKPKNSKISPKKVLFEQGKHDYDLIITVDCAELKQLSNIYKDNIELFHELPILNIDHHISNEYYGKINHVDIMASSTTELLLPIFEDLAKQHQTKVIDEDIATLLLAGIITDTGSFQNANTTPRSFAKAAKLIAYGARQQEIIKHVYKTKQLSQLKLWGRLLSKLQTDPQYRMVWSVASKQDFKDLGANPDETGDIIDELMTNAPGAEVIFLMKEIEEGLVSVSMRTSTPNVDASEIAKHFNGGGHAQAAGFKIKNLSLREAENKVIEYLKEYQEKRLNTLFEGVKSLDGQKNRKSKSENSKNKHISSQNNHSASGSSKVDASLANQKEHQSSQKKEENRDKNKQKDQNGKGGSQSSEKDVVKKSSQNQNNSEKSNDNNSSNKKKRKRRRKKKKHNQESKEEHSQSTSQQNSSNSSEKNSSNSQRNANSQQFKKDDKNAGKQDQPAKNFNDKVSLNKQNQGNSFTKNVQTNSAIENQNNPTQKPNSVPQQYSQTTSQVNPKLNPQANPKLNPQVNPQANSKLNPQVNPQVNPQANMGYYNQYMNYYYQNNPAANNQNMYQNQANFNQMQAGSGQMQNAAQQNSNFQAQQGQNASFPQNNYQQGPALNPNQINNQQVQDSQSNSKAQAEIQKTDSNNSAKKIQLNESFSKPNASSNQTNTTQSDQVNSAASSSNTKSLEQNSNNDSKKSDESDLSSRELAMQRLREKYLEDQKAKKEKKNSSNNFDD